MVSKSGGAFTSGDAFTSGMLINGKLSSLTELLSGKIISKC